MGDWSELNYDVLGEIVLKLDAIEDFVYFSVVCRSWNRASSLVKYTWKPSLPCLLLAQCHEKRKPDFLREIYCLDTDRCYRLSLPHTFGARCWGSEYGWIVTFRDQEIHLHNPFTKARIRLPPLPTLIRYQKPQFDNKHEDDSFCSAGSIKKAIVVKDVDNDLIVFTIHGNTEGSLAFARPGDLTWTSIVPPWPFTHRVADVLCRDRLILILYKDASVGYVELSNLSKSANLEQYVEAQEFLLSPEAFMGHLSIKVKFFMEMYLVESFGSLLMVLRYRSTIWDPNRQVSQDEFYKTVRFEVFWIDFKSKKWDPIKDLGDVALFVGNNQSISVRASDCRNCKPNCIYFTDDCEFFRAKWLHLGAPDMGFYDLEDGEIYQFYKGGDVHSIYCTPFWFMPQF